MRAADQSPRLGRDSLSRAATATVSREPDSGPAVRWQREVPEAIRSLDTLTSPDYADLFTAAASQATDWPAEQWARAVFEGAPAPMRLLIPFVHRVVLGLRLESRPSPDHLLGWRIAHREDSWVRMETGSWFMTPHLVLKVDEGRLSVATFIRYDRRLAALVWPPVSILHRRVGLVLLRHVLRAPGAVRQVAVPPAVRALSTLSGVDYADTYLVDVGRAQDRTAEEWARAILEGAPKIMQRALRSAWSALGLRSTGSDRSVLGWELRRSTSDHVLLGAGSRIGMPAELLLKRERGGLLFATFVRHENPLARAVWAGIEPGHRSVVRYALEQASRRIRARERDR